MNEEPASSHLADVADLVLRVYEIHEDVLAATGGSPGLRDVAALHAAVARPFATYGGEELYPTDWEKAAALFHSLIKGRPFVDGSKRTAFAAALYFLERCGHTLPLVFPQDEVLQFCLEVAEEGGGSATGPTAAPMSIADIAAWFRKLMVQRARQHE